MRRMPRAEARTGQQHFDPPYAPNVEVFDHLTHAEIHAGVKSLRPAILVDGGQAWGVAAAHLAEAISEAHIEIRAAIADGWRGAAAENANAVVRVFEQNGQELADVFAVVSQRLDRASDAAEAVRAAVPEPTDMTPDLGAALLDQAQASNNAYLQKMSEHARHDVVRAMNDIYAGVFLSTGTDVPAFPDAEEHRAPDTTEHKAPHETNHRTPGAAGAPTGRAASNLPITADAQPMPPDTTSHRAGETTEPSGNAKRPGLPADVAATPTTTAGSTPTGPLSAGPAPVTTASPIGPTAETPPTTAAATTSNRTVPTGHVSRSPATAASWTNGPWAVPGTSAASSEQQQRQDERRKHTEGDTVTGPGAGMAGGLLGGAMATTDTTRPATNRTTTTTRATSHHDEDDEFDPDDSPTYLEPSAEGGELIGPLEPTTPPVLGEWTEDE
ncbi:hypothetical protein ACL02S_08825 [Nocardia sp. 004]|uniref:PPE domain-containing protein n=1 Tax=Nocardia sp. 004 TaxID=3385978 RepID=UPI0039A2C054